MTDRMDFQLTAAAAEAYEHHAAPIMRPFVELLLDAVGLQHRAALLDVACGTGFAARRAAARTGGTIRICGADANQDMLNAAGAAAPGAGIAWMQASADALPCPDADFDAVVSQQGAQYFPDLEAAAAEMARVSRPGGRVAVTVWAAMDRSPYFAAQGTAIAAVAGHDAFSSYEVAFRCTADRLLAAFGAVGLKEVTAREVTAEVPLPPLPEFVPSFLSALPWAQALADARPEGLAAAADIVRRQLAPRTRPDGSSVLPFTAILLTATR